MLKTHVKSLDYLNSEIASNHIAKSGKPLPITRSDKARRVVMNLHADELQPETLVLLQLLSLGQRDIDAGCMRETEEVFADIERDGAP